MEIPASITLSEYIRSYTGGVRKPKVIVKNGKLSFTVKSQGNYSGSRTITYTIDKRAKVLAFTQRPYRKNTEISNTIK